MNENERSLVQNTIVRLDQIHNGQAKALFIAYISTLLEAGKETFTRYGGDRFLSTNNIIKLKQEHVWLAVHQ